MLCSAPFTPFLTACVGVYLMLLADSVSALPHTATASSTNFQVRSHSPSLNVTELLDELQQLHLHLAKRWLQQSSPLQWAPRCEIVVHATHASYLQAVGHGGRHTLGSSYVQTRHGRVVRRRIDLLPDANGHCSALAHELTHIVLADRFAGRQPPRWLDEGIALQADSREKQDLHRRDLLLALQAGTTWRLAELLHLEDCRSASQVATFYGQSQSLVSYLLTRGEPATLLAFSEAAEKHGYPRALAVHYSIASISDLEQEWHQHVTTRVAQQTETMQAAAVR